MAKILNIETSSQTCSVALYDGNKSLGFAESTGVNEHSSNLTVFIEEIVKNTGMELNSIDAVSVSKGPGSYTGLRIGVSVAKGICYGLNKPLIGICTLQAMTYGVLQKEEIQNLLAKNNSVLFCPMIDARRMEVYTTLYDNLNLRIKDITAEILTEHTFVEFLNSGIVVFFGNGAKKFKNIISYSNAYFIDGIEPSAKNMHELSLKAYENKGFEDVAYFEPFYLKDFVTTVPKKMI